MLIQLFYAVHYVWLTFEPLHGLIYVDYNSFIGDPLLEMKNKYHYEVPVVLSHLFNRTRSLGSCCAWCSSSPCLCLCLPIFHLVYHQELHHRVQVLHDGLWYTLLQQVTLRFHLRVLLPNHRFHGGLQIPQTCNHYTLWRYKEEKRDGLPVEFRLESR